MSNSSRMLTISPNRRFDSNHPFRYPSDRLAQRGHALDRKKVIDSLDYYHPTMAAYRCLEEPFRMFDVVGLNPFIMFSQRTHAILVRDFYRTLELEYEGNEVVAWKFEIQGIPLAMTRDEFVANYGMKRGARVPSYTEEERRDFWTFITGMSFYSPDCSPRCIDLGFWKYVHRLVSVNINSRKDQGGRVFRDDLDIMLAMSLGQPLDFFGIISKRFEQGIDVSPRCRNKALGCSSFITQIAMSKGFIFDDHEIGAYRVLNEAALYRMKLIDRAEKRWIHDPKLPVKNPRASHGTPSAQRDSYTWEEYHEEDDEEELEDPIDVQPLRTVYYHEQPDVKDEGPSTIAKRVKKRTQRREDSRPNPLAIVEVVTLDSDSE